VKFSIIEKGTVKGPLFLEQVERKENFNLPETFSFVFDARERIARFQPPALSLPKRVEMPKVLCFEENGKFTSAILFVEKENCLALSALCPGTFVLLPPDWKVVSDEAEFQYHSFDRYHVSIAYSTAVSLPDLKVVCGEKTVVIVRGLK
jgi:hypothetical protein